MLPNVHVHQHEGVTTCQQGRTHIHAIHDARQIIKKKFKWGRSEAYVMYTPGLPH